MTDEKEILTQDKSETTQKTTKKVSIKMLPNELAGQPLYSNFSTVNAGQGVVLVDFGFLDPQNLNILNQMAISGEKLPDVINVKLSSRMAVSVDTARHLSQQLNQLLSAKPPEAVVHSQQDTNEENTNDPPVSTDSNAGVDGLDTQKSDKGGFRFPWSKKTH
ncbi:hypothetical protein [uncultured Nitrosomonas sp.]|uniref:hypothetical protein n=1 Tax=uncultured Nitrosomonas sp. TaxID=156424 RepID=UPI0025F6C72D|nr:hypothetical protein [uncultured Nitrosomonas sp.]